MRKKFQTIGITATVLSLTACSNSLPSCNSKEAKDLISQIVAERSYSLGNFVELKSAKEEAFNKDSQIRTCQAKLITTKDSDDIYYSISWKDRESGLYWLEIN